MASVAWRGNTFHPPPGSQVSQDAPGSCPSCRSSDIVTTAKVPDASSYWRCKKCGDIWNSTRCDAPRGGGRTWR